MVDVGLVSISFWCMSHPINCSKRLSGFNRLVVGLELSWWSTQKLSFNWDMISDEWIYCSTQRLWAVATAVLHRWWRRGCWSHPNCRWFWHRAIRRMPPTPPPLQPSRKRLQPPVKPKMRKRNWSNNRSSRTNNTNSNNSNNNSSKWRVFGPAFQWPRVDAGRRFRAPFVLGLCPLTPLSLMRLVSIFFYLKKNNIKHKIDPDVLALFVPLPCDVWKWPGANHVACVDEYLTE